MSYRLKRVFVVLLVILLGLNPVLFADEYFVGLDGSDANDGLSRASAFATVQRGVDALDPGDTLTITPGEYHENVSREDLGSMEAETVIRAEIPGTVLLRGDVDAPRFEPVEGFRNVYSADFDRDVQAVTEVDTLRVLRLAPDLAELEFNPGHCYYDADAQRLYISPTDLQPPEAHRYRVSVLQVRAGLLLHRARRVTVEGLAVSGFHSREPFPRMQGGNSASDITPWGVFLPRARGCVVRDVASYLNTGGIAIRSHRDTKHGGGNLIEGCTAYGNYGRHGIIVYIPNDDEIRDSQAYFNGRTGIQFYLTAGGRSRMLDNLAWSNYSSDFQLKAGGPHLAERCVGPGGWGQESRGDDVRHSLIGRIASIPDQYHGNIGPDELTDIDENAEFADPANRDYRLQATSRFRGAGTDGEDLGAFAYEPNIYYVSPEGDDSADGLSVSAAWRSAARAVGRLEPGDTLYLEEGAYAEDIELNVDSGEHEEPVRILGRGTGTVELGGKVELRGAGHVEFERLHFTGPVLVRDSRSVRFANSRFVYGGVSLNATGARGLRIVHCEFAGFGEAAVVLADSTGTFLQGNIFENASGAAVRMDSADSLLYSDYNTYSRADAAWTVGGAGWSLEHVRQLHGWYSRQADPRFVGTQSPLRLENTVDFAACSPMGRPAGNFRPIPEQRASVAGPQAHAVGATTANIEWHTTVPTTIELAWGTSDEDEETHRIRPIPHEHFGTFSMSGLEPSTTYHVRILSAETEESDREIEWSREPIAFTTAAEYPDPVTYYVSPDGDDANPGTSPEAPMRTLNHAAANVRPGDRVLIAGGVYRERLRVRSTGTAERPIKFAAKPGHRVVLDGDELLINLAIAQHKSHLRLDGLFLRNVPRVACNTEGAIRLFDGEDIKLTRIFYDGRGPLYSPDFVHGENVRHLLIRNSVAMNAFSGSPQIGRTRTRACPEFRMENTLIIRNMIWGMNFVRPLRQEDRGLMRNSIITDCLPGKVNTTVGPVSSTEWLELDNNAHYLREERSSQGRLTMDEFRERVAEDNGILGDPQFAVLFEDGQDPGDGFTVDRLFGGQFRNREFTFSDFFATNPEFIERGIGLQPEAFADFYFNVEE